MLGQKKVQAGSPACMSVQEQPSVQEECGRAGIPRTRIEVQGIGRLACKNEENVGFCNCKDNLNSNFIENATLHHF